MRNGTLHSERKINELRVNNKKKQTQNRFFQNLNVNFIGMMQVAVINYALKTDVACCDILTGPNIFERGT